MRTTPLLLVLASRRDTAARALVERLGGGARLLTPEDVSAAGWRYRPGHPDQTTVVASGQPLAARDIGGVITRLAYVPPHELTGIAPEDRDYVAAEMNAFLIAWLSELPRPVLNRPTAGSLSGPSWREERWLSTAAGLGIPIRPLRRSSGAGGAAALPALEQAGATVTFIGDRCLGAPHPVLAEHTRRLAGAAGVSLLATHFSGPGPEARLIGAYPMPALADDGVLQAVHACLRAS